MNLGRHGFTFPAENAIAFDVEGDRHAIAQLEVIGTRSIWGAMVDMYPADVAGIRDNVERPFSLNDPWFFDAVAHIHCKPGQRKPTTLYRGVRARLMAQFGVLTKNSWWQRLEARLGIRRIRKATRMYKVPLLKWSAGASFIGSHQITPPPQSGNHLAIMHFKLTQDLERKIRYALATKGYANGSREYLLYDSLLAKMAGTQADFAWRHSKQFGRAADFYDCGIGRWQA